MIEILCALILSEKKCLCIYVAIKKRTKSCKWNLFYFPHFFRQDNEHNIGTEIKKRGEYNEAMGLRSGLFMRFVL